MIEGLIYLYLVLLLFPILIYPSLIWCLSRFKSPLKPQPKQSHQKNEENYPKVTLITVAKNEERIIEEKIKNLLSLDYPSEKRETIIVDDNSDDQTSKIIQKYAGEGIKLMQNPVSE